MKLSSLSRWTIVLLLYAIFPINAQVLGDLKIAVIRVSFPLQDYPGISGNGDFLYAAKPIECGDYTIDPPPHDRHYFQSHLIAVDNITDQSLMESLGSICRIIPYFPQRMNPAI